MHERSKGFTLIEMLVVISIIGLLTTIVFIVLDSAKKEGRDAKRAAETNQLRLALNAHYTFYGYYPNPNGSEAAACLGEGGPDAFWNVLCDPTQSCLEDADNLYCLAAASVGDGSINGGSDWGNSFKEILKDWFPDGPPKDPVNNSKYRYIYGYTSINLGTEESPCHYGISYCSEDLGLECDILDQDNRGGIRITPLCGGSQLAFIPNPPPPPGSYEIKSITTITESGGRVNWGKNNIIAFDRMGIDGFYDVWTMNPDGSGKKCLTCAEAGDPHMNGNPSWHPSGNYIVFQSENPDLSNLVCENFAESPGGGINNDLWITNPDGSQFWQLTFMTDRKGVLHPEFSHDGTKLIWAERMTFPANCFSGFWGQWEIKIADFSVVDGVPTISNIQGIQPGDMGLYETHGFSPNDDKITFSASQEDLPAQSFDEFIYDLDTQQLTSLTGTQYEWDEFALFTPDGNKIIWTSTLDILQNRNADGYVVAGEQKQDLWIMDPDGSNKKRLTHFNSSLTDSTVYPELTADGAVVAEHSWNPDGTQIVIKLRTYPGEFWQNEKIVIIEFEK